jgi:hypothetical protein
VQLKMDLTELYLSNINWIEVVCFSNQGQIFDSPDFIHEIVST